MKIKNIEDRAKRISEFRCLNCISIADMLTPESKYIQFDLLFLYNKWNKFLGHKDISFSRFLNIYCNDLLLIYAQKEAILSLNNLDAEKWEYEEPLKDWQEMNLLIKSYKPVYHLVNLTVLLRINYERFILCLQQLFQCNQGKRFEAKREAIICKMEGEGVDQNLITVVKSIDISKIKEYREKIIHNSGLSFHEFFPATRNNLDFDEYLSEIRKEIARFYILLKQFVSYSIGEEPKFNFNLPSMSKEGFEKQLKETKNLRECAENNENL